MNSSSGGSKGLVTGIILSFISSYDPMAILADQSRKTNADNLTGSAQSWRKQYPYQLIGESCGDGELRPLNEGRACAPDALWHSLSAFATDE